MGHSEPGPRERQETRMRSRPETAKTGLISFNTIWTVLNRLAWRSRRAAIADC